MFYSFMLKNDEDADEEDFECYKDEASDSRQHPDPQELYPGRWDAPRDTGVNNMRARPLGYQGQPYVEQCSPIRSRVLPTSPTLESPVSLPPMTVQSPSTTTRSSRRSSNSLPLYPSGILSPPAEDDHVSLPEGLSNGEIAFGIHSSSNTPPLTQQQMSSPPAEMIGALWSSSTLSVTQQQQEEDSSLSSPPLVDLNGRQALEVPPPLPSQEGLMLETTTGDSNRNRQNDHGFDRYDDFRDSDDVMLLQAQEESMGLFTQEQQQEQEELWNQHQLQQQQRQQQQQQEQRLRPQHPPNSGGPILPAEELPPRPCTVTPMEPVLTTRSSRRCVERVRQGEIKASLVLGIPLPSNLPRSHHVVRCSLCCKEVHVPKVAVVVRCPVCKAISPATSNIDQRTTISGERR